MTVEIGGLVTSYNNPANNNYDTPTNPLITFNPVLSAGNRIFSLVLSSGAATPAAARFDEIVSGADLLTEYSNLHATDGFSIRCFDSFNNVGIDLASVDLSTNDYFVLIHSDDENMHHFAKITKITGVGADQDGDKFHFSPRLGSEIAKDVKFMLFKGPSTTTNLIAITAGIKTEVSKLVCARPYFYFYDDKLDTAGELDHSDKYFIRTKTLANTSTDASILLNTGGDNTTFTTISDYRNKIVDYSRFNYSITLKDKLKELDDPDVGTSNESTALSGTFTTLTDYNDCFINAKRDTNDDTATKIFTGNKRYVYYNTSPEINNYMPSVYEAEIEDSFDKAGFASLSMIDITKNLSNRVFVDDRLVAYQRLQEDDLREWVEVGTISALHTSPRTYTLTQLKERPNLFFVANMEVKIGTRICIIDSVASTDRIVLKADSRLETEAAFTTTTSLSSFAQGDKVYRRRMSHLDSTYITSANFEESKLSRMSGLVQATSYPTKHCDIGSLITNANDDYGLLTITFGNNILDSTSGLERVQGNFVLYYEVFYGAVEQVERRLEEGQTFMDIKSRYSLAKLVDVIVNKNTLFSSDVIYSSQSPYNDLITTGQTATWEFNDKTITFTSSVSLSANDHLWCEYGYIGQVESGSGTSYELYDHPYTMASSATTVFKENSKLYMLNKALAGNKDVASITSLTGTSDKGFHFRDGIKLTGNFNALADGATLVGTSDDTSTKAVGYNIDKVKNVDGDLDFNLDITGFSDDIVNTLIDFTILSVKGGDTKTVKLAPYMPLTLGREKDNRATVDDSFTNLAQLSMNPSNTNVIGCTPSTFTNYDLQIGTSVYINGVFVGIYLGYRIRAGDDPIVRTDIYLDRAITASQGDYLQIGDGKKTRSFLLTNGAHLHGSKVINYLGPNNLPIDFRLLGYYVQNPTETSVKQKFGADIIRIKNKEKGKIDEDKTYLITQDSDKGRRQSYYGDSPVLNYFAEGLQGHPDFSGGLTTHSKTGTTNNNHHALATRGYKPIIGSSYVDREFTSSVDTNSIITYSEPHIRISSESNHITNYPNPLDTRDKFFQIDPKAARLFLFCNSDRLLYSSTRKDSLMVAKSSDSAANKFLEAHGLLSLSPPRKTTSSSAKDEIVGDSSTITNLDTDYKHSSIISSNKVLSNLKRIGLMRLTDVVYDWAFNPINPEFDVPNDRVIESVKVPFFDAIKVQDSGGNDLTVSSVDNGGIVMNTTVDNVSANDLILDVDNNKIIGYVTGLSTDTTTNDKINIGFYNATDSGSRKYSSGDNVFFVQNAKLVEFSRVVGRGEEETMLFNVAESGDDATNIHMLKGVITNDDSPTAWTTYYKEESTSNMASDFPKLQKSTTHGIQTFLLPIAFEGIYRASFPNGNNIYKEPFFHFSISVSSGNWGSTQDVDRKSQLTYTTSEIFKFFNGLEGGNTSNSGKTFGETSASAIKIVALKTFKTEDSNLDAGLTSPFLHKASLGYAFANPLSNTTPQGRFLTYPTFNLDTADSFFSSSADTTGGAYLGFKPHLITPSVLGNNDVRSIKNTTLKRNNFDLTGDRHFLKYIDLTGCYLVPAEKGKHYESNDVVSGSSLKSSHEMTINDNEIIYVVSHEYDISDNAGNPSCVLITDEALSTSTKYKIMQPNPICFWDKSPNKIRLNTLSKSYTKRMDSDNMYDSFPAFDIGDRTGTRDNESNLEGVQSMYVMVDIDNLSAEGNTIVKTATGRETILSGFTGNFCVSDGEKVIETEINGTDLGDDIGHYLEFAEISKLDGVVSVSETFELQVNGDIEEGQKRAIIGANISVAPETEDIVEELLIENDITHTLTKENYKVISSPNFQGNTLFGILNYFLGLKDKRMVNVSGSVEIQSADSSDFASKYTFDDDSITDVEVSKSNFDYYNHITVYGQRHKETRRDFRAIKKRGKKSLEVFNNKLTTQEDVSNEATNLLRIHTTLNNIVSFKINNSDVGTVGVGDVITLESKFVGIERNQYIVLDTVHSFTGLVELRVGRYFNGLEDVLSDILANSSQTNSYLRQSEFNANENAYDFLEELTITEVYFTARRKTSSGSFKLGFGTALNTGTTTLGFAGGTTTFTRLLEENL